MKSCVLKKGPVKDRCASSKERMPSINKNLTEMHVCWEVCINHEVKKPFMNTALANASCFNFLLIKK